MNIVKLGTNIVSKSRSYITRQAPGLAKRKVPRFLYHITNQESYNKIIESGHLTVGHDTLASLNGIYLFDLKNVLKRWNSDKATWYLGLGLLGLSLKTGKKVVVLRIPIKDLNPEALKIRSLQRFASNSAEDVKHVNFGDSVKRAKHFTEKKEAIEYIYPTEIPVSKDNLVGTSEIGMNIEELWDLATQDKQKQKEFFTIKMKELFKSSPEEKSINIWL